MNVAPAGQLAITLNAPLSIPYYPALPRPPNMFIPLISRYADNESCSSTSASCTVPVPPDDSSLASSPQNAPAEQNLGQRNFIGLVVIAVLVVLGIFLWVLFGKGAQSKRIRKFIRREKEPELPTQTVIRVVRNVETGTLETSQTKDTVTSIPDKVREVSLGEEFVQNTKYTRNTRPKLWERMKARWARP
ncbi:hypothetical protein EW146_g3943 [Bondarzewia mesenterica]|uniref:Uncharacterized protein n=1 Tax=Bondarzewia mesenterica TaxID=1095465 RepID=A0A4S4LW13_9AGAM|nr:hypothetical protein EW146_g3943 [Bondarzewia mesenterica]